MSDQARGWLFVVLLTIGLYVSIQVWWHADPGQHPAPGACWTSCPNNGLPTDHLPSWATAGPTP